MDYKVTARKWRPQSFEEIIGQDNLVLAIKNSLSSGKIPHALLFSGVRGVGKTTTARIIAKALNCQNPHNMEPCNKCSSCTEITNGYSLDVIEIDGASNRGIDNIRELKDTVAYMPMSGKYKVYIIDEVHMLTNEASNALLKTLEEPPSHAIFILATTEAHKVIPTIKSRCQHYIFKKISSKSIVEQLKIICKEERIKFTEDGLFLIANSSDGSLRDAESIFDQVVIYSSANITEQSASDLIGIPDIHYFINIIESVKSTDIIRMLKTTSDYIESIGDIKIFTKGIILFLKNGILIKKLSYNDDLLEMPQKKYNEMTLLFIEFSIEDIIKIINIFVDLYKDLKGDANERFLLETALFKIMDYKNIYPIGSLRKEIIAYLENNKNKNISDHDNNLHNINSDASEKDIKKVVLEILSGSQITKAMLQAINKIEISNNTIHIEISVLHSYEYLEKNKKEILNELNKRINKDFNIKFSLNKLRNDENEYIENNEKSMHFKDEKENKPEIVKEIVNLFDGKIQ